MGGTSTDVSHFDGEYERAFETEVAGVRMRAPMMLIHTVAAGGGSILHFDGARFRVGPDSAGANPGPKCYRRNGPLAVTDANVMVGKLIPDFFPKIFGPAQDQPLDAAAVRHGFNNLAQKVGGKTPEEIADGFIKIAVENMANAIKKISVQRGYDVTRYALNCFGGAGGQHACLVADALGMTQGADPSVLVAALGLRHGARRHPRDAPAGDRTGVRRQGARRASSARARGSAKRPRRKSPARACRRARSRSSCARISATPAPTRRWWWRRAPCPRCSAPSRRRTRRASASSTARKQMVVEAVSVEAVGGGAKFSERAGKAHARQTAAAGAAHAVLLAGEWHKANVYTRDQLKIGAQASKAPPSSSSRTRPSWSSRAGRPSSRAKITWC